MATTKQFGISGVGSDLQLGKGGGRFVFDEGVFKITTDGTALGNVRTALPVNDNDAANKAYVDSLSAGLDPKESVRAATTANIVLDNTTTTLDGVTLADGNRVLVKNQTDPVENGIYVVSTSGAWTRATDFDGNPAAEVSGGAFTFVEAGTVNINSGFVVQADGVLTVGTDAINFVQFSGAGSITAGVGLSKTGETLNVDLFDADPGDLPAFAGTVDGANDILLFGNEDDSTTQSITVDKLFNDMDVVKGITANGFITRTADDVYASRSFDASVVAGEEGVTVTDGAGAAGNPTFGLDINGLTAAGTLAGTEEFVVFDGTNNVKTTIGAILADQDVVTADDALTGMVQVTAGVLTSTSVTAATGNGLLGLNVANGGTAPVIGLDINGLTSTSALELADSIAIYSNDNTTNEKATIQDIVDIVAANSSDNEISQGDSSIIITDAATGDIAVTVDGTTVATFTDGVTQFAGEVKLKSAEVDSGIVHVLADGTLETTTGFTFDGTDMATPGAITATGGVTADSFTDAGLTNNAMLVANGTGEIISQTNVVYSASELAVTGAITSTTDITATGNIAGVNGTFSGTVDGTTITASTGFVDANLTENAVLIADASGSLVSSALALNGAGDVLTVGQIQIDGSTGSGNVISTTNTDGDLILAPNGAGEVVIGNAGVATQIVAEDDQSLTLSGGESSDGIVDAGDINVFGGDSSGGGAGGDVVVQAGTSDSGTSGTTQFLDANDNLVAEIVNSPASTDGHIDISAGASLAAEGTGTDIDLNLVPKGTGQVLVPASYVPTTDDSLVDKAYVDEQIAGNVVPGSVGSVSAVVDLTSTATVALGTIPANATVFEVRVNVTTASGSDALLDIGNATAGADIYMTDAEVDTTAGGLYSADCFVTNTGVDVTANATVGAAGGSGSATVIVFYRNQ